MQKQHQICKGLVGRSNAWQGFRNRAAWSACNKGHKSTSEMAWAIYLKNFVGAFSRDFPWMHGQEL